MQNQASTRKDILAIRKALSPETLEANAKAATAHILTLTQWQNARQVLLYMPIANEVDTMALMHNAWATGKEVLLPRCDTREKGIMHVALCRSMEELVRGSYGILEPDPEQCPNCTPPQLCPDVAIIPAVAFDVCGNRLGYGGGYFDRFLVQDAMAKTCLIGLAHHAQIVPSLPAEFWDRTMHVICTEHGISTSLKASCNGAYGENHGPEYSSSHTG